MILLATNMQVLPFEAAVCAVIVLTGILSLLPSLLNREPGTGNRKTETV